jgi:orotate phosphoribosyltransferase
VNEAHWLEVFERSGAILSGHFELTSGLHSDLYVQKARVLEDPQTAMALAREIVSWYEPGGIDAVLAPAVGAVPLGFAVALAAQARSLYAEREGGRMCLRRGFVLHPGEPTLVVEDVITTGRSAKEVLGLVQGSGADALGVAALVDRSRLAVDLPLRALLRIDATSWAVEACPLCLRGVPLDAPGSRHLSEATG